ncbi:DnaB-like helicase C-terminal domain-containing protein [Carnobacteriaceae bacterium zg-ZUI78]|nr:DnaB-like helicase C-terminal domain-containing protein [Carnobacteriaceae bacterium zg-ZUI78]
MAKTGDTSLMIEQQLERFKIEAEIVSCVLNDVRLLDTKTVDPLWFSSKTYATILKAVLKDKTLVDNLFELHEMTKAELIHEKQYDLLFLVNLKSQVITTANFSYLVTRLHVIDLRQILEEKKQEHTIAPNKKTEEDMLSILSLISNIQKHEESGDLAQTFDELDYELSHDVSEGLKTFGRLDTVLGGSLYGGVFMIIGARPSVGKSAFAVNFMDKVFQRNENVRIDLFSAEMDKKEVVRRIISLKTGINSYALKNMNKRLTKQEKEIVSAALNEYKQKDLKIHSETNIKDIVRIIKQRAREVKKDKYLAVIDYIGLIRSEGFANNKRLELEDVSRELKVLTTELYIPIVALTQLSRNIESRQDKRPVLSDIRESGAIEQDANVVAFLYQDEKKIQNQNQKREMELIVMKNREGSLMTLHFDFYPQKMLFDENFSR